MIPCLAISGKKRSRNAETNRKTILTKCFIPSPPCKKSMRLQTILARKMHKLHGKDVASLGLTDKVLTGIAQKMELPADVLAGVPRIILIGHDEFQIEPHRGLGEYSQSEVKIYSKIGPISVIGNSLSIRLMNQTRMIITGRISAVKLSEVCND